MDEKLKWFLVGLAWTAIEACSSAITATGASAISEINWDKVLFGVLVGALIYIAKTPIQNILQSSSEQKAVEMTDEEYEELPKEEYQDTENYDDRYIDETVEDDEGDDDEME